MKAVEWQERLAFCRNCIYADISISKYLESTCMN
jgi:hypothetical protein